MRISAFSRSRERKQSHIYPSRSLKKVAISFDHDPTLFSTANPADEVFGRHNRLAARQMHQSRGRVERRCDIECRSSPRTVHATHLRSMDDKRRLCLRSRTAIRQKRLGSGWGPPLYAAIIVEGA